MKRITFGSMTALLLATACGSPEGATSGTGGPSSEAVVESDEADRSNSAASQDDTDEARPTDTDSDSDSDSDSEPTEASGGAPSSESDIEPDPTGSGGDGGDGADANIAPSKPNPCGNGQPDQGEMCDDGNDVVGDGCNPDCIKGGYNYRLTGQTIPNKQNLHDLVLVGNSVVAVGRMAEFNDPTKFDRLVVKLDISQEPLNPIGSGSAIPGNDESLQAISTDGSALFTVGTCESDAGGQDGLLERRQLNGLLEWSRLFDGTGHGADSLTGINAAGFSLQFVGTFWDTTSGDDMTYLYTSKSNYGQVGTYPVSTLYPDTGSAVAPMGGGHASVVTGSRGLVGGGSELWVRHITSGGVAGWTKTFARRTKNMSMATSADDRIAIAGDLYDQSWKTFLLVLDSEGTELWFKTLTHKSIDGVTFDPTSGDVLIVGSYVDDSQDAFLQRFDTEGNERWFRGYDFANLSDAATGVVVAPDGTLWVSGWWSPSANDNDYWIGQFAP